jgi:pyruvate dehydrogenase complex dehydrogenase (E1) component
MEYAASTGPQKIISRIRFRMKIFVGLGLYENRADQIAPWVPGGLTTLGTDGFGRVTPPESPAL